MALQAAMQVRSREHRDRRLQGIQAVVERQQDVVMECDHHGFLLGVSAFDRASFGPMATSAVVWRLHHFCTVVGLMPWH